MKTYAPVWLVNSAVAWAEAQAAAISVSGVSLSHPWRTLAANLGVQAPDRIRLSIVAALPMPTNLDLLQAMRHLKLLGPEVTAITFGYGVYITDGSVKPRTFSQQFSRVSQYERAGGIRGFLPQFLDQLLAHGIENAPFELEARRAAHSSINAP